MKRYAIELASQKLAKHLWSKAHKLSQDDVDFYTEIMEELWDTAQKQERIEQKRVQEVKNI